jgi:hypothetical protein
MNIISSYSRPLSLRHYVQTRSGAPPPSLLFSGYRGILIEAEAAGDYI